MKENHNSSKVRFNPRKLASKFRRQSDAQAYLEYRGWSPQSNGLFTRKFDDAIRRIVKLGNNHWVILA